MTPIMNALRPCDGSSSRISRSSTPPCDAFDVSMSGASAVTVIVSSIVPTSSVRSSVTNCCVAIRMPRRSNVL